MTANKPIRILFWIAALYDGLLGLAFLIGGAAVFERVGVEPPNHLGYIQFPAALLLIFALMFAAIAVRPAAHRDLILYGILLKLAYCAVVFGHWLAAGVPWIWKPFAIADLLFLILFFWARQRLGDKPAAA